jgi:hypothetical protein
MAGFLRSHFGDQSRATEEPNTARSFAIVRSLSATRSQAFVTPTLDRPVRDEGVAGSNPATPTNAWVKSKQSPAPIAAPFRNGESTLEQIDRTGTRHRFVNGAFQLGCRRCFKVALTDQRHRGGILGFLEVDEIARRKRDTHGMLGWLQTFVRHLLCFFTPRLNSASDYESGGQEFESLRARQKTNLIIMMCRNDCCISCGLDFV